MDFQRTSDLEGYIGTLTEEERSRFAELIAECRQRDAQIIKDVEMANLSAEGLEKLEKKIIDVLTELDEASKRLLRQTANTYLLLFDGNEIYCS
ncbi:MAG: hypothetical protein PHY31_01925 [Smithellaceae bacterium]|nr:hypothetical protein [Smithellaceae bacterium]